MVWLAWQGDLLLGNGRILLERIERQYGKARRVWLMDRGVPTEEVLAEMRAADPPVHYLVGTPKGRLTRLEKHLIAQPWQQARPGVQVKLLAQEGELYVLAQSRDRVAKERAMRRRQLKWLWARLKQLSMMALSREELLMKLGAARAHAPAAWRLVVIAVAPEGVTFTYHQRHVGRENIWPKGGDISVGPYSSTAPPVMRSATMPRILSRMRSPMTSRSNCAKDNKTFRVRRPIEVVVLNCCVTETKDAPLASSVGRETH